MKLHGVFGPVVTTFHRGSQDLDVESFVRNIRSHLAAGMHGIVVCGSTGEAVLLSEDERRILLEAARGVVPRDRALLMGAGGESTRATVQRCRDAKLGGADGVLVVAPHYYANAMSLPALRGHYRAVADASPVPVVLYNIPKYMHFSLPPELVAELASHPNVVGIKDSSGDLGILRGFLRAQSDTFTVMTGNGGTFAPALAMGARGGILAVALFAAGLSLHVYAAHERGNRAEADSLQATLRPLAVTIVGELGVPGVKAAMDAVGLAGGLVRSPLVDLDAAARERVRGLVAGLAAAAA
jgi:4-hydroxy-2-oxoglutarate aldolase